MNEFSRRECLMVLGAVAVADLFDSVAAAATASKMLRGASAMFCHERLSH
jgi:hypothetical protein